MADDRRHGRTGPTRWPFLSLILAAALLWSPRPFMAQAPQEKQDEAADKDKKEKRDLPLEPDRAIEFDTTEGSWISLDVSPDGRRIVFELLGDLYSLPIAGGPATRVLAGAMFDSQPRYSPDGTKLVFLSDRSGDENIWVADGDGTNPRAITKGKNTRYWSPEWTPDGKYIIVSRSGSAQTGTQLWLYHVDGGSGVNLTGSEERRQLNPLGAAFGKDDRFVYYTERTATGSVYNQMTFRWQLGMYDRHTGENFRMSDELGSAMRPVLSPDGRWLVYATRWDAQTGLRVRDLRSGDDAWLIYPVTRDDQESASTRDLMPGSSFTPDSKALITSYDGRIWRVDVPSGEATEIPFTAKVEQKIGPRVQFDYPVDDGVVRAQQIRHPRLSPDGRRLAFTALDRLWVMDYPGGTPRRVSAFEAGEHQPAWSPDGRYVAYVTWSDADGGHLYRVAVDGGIPQRLTQTASFYSDPVYSPDGQRIVMVRGPRGERQEDFSPQGRGGQAMELVWVPAAGGDTTLVSPYRGQGRPHFAKDPNRLYAWEGTRGLVSFRWDGTDRKTHVKVTGYKNPNAEQATNATDVIMGPNGEQAIAEAQHHMYLLTVPVKGGEAPTVALASPDSAAVPVRKLTTVGGEFMAWADDGKSVTFALGRTLFKYDLAAAKAAEDAERQKTEKSGTPPAEPKPGDTPPRKKPAYEPVATEVVVEAQRSKPSGTVVLRGARIITMVAGAGATGADAKPGGMPAIPGDPVGVIESGDIVIKDNRIEAVGRRGQVTIPSGARTIDVAGKTIMPGLVDVHAHIWPAWNIHKTQVWEYLANLAYGVTTTRDPQTATTDVLSYRDMVETGQMIGPRVFGTGPGVFVQDNVQSLEEARDVLKRYSQYWDTKTIKQYMAGNRQQRQWIIMAAREQKLMPTLEGGLDLKLNLTQILDGYPGLEHTLPIMPLYKDVIQLVARSGIVYTPTLLVQYGGPWAENYFYESTDVHGDRKMRRFTPHRDLDESVLRRPWFHEQEYSFPLAARVLAEIVAAGGRVGLGGHGQRQGIQCHWELWAIASGGMPTHEVLKVGTVYGAEGIGMSQDLGTLAKGKLADLIVLDRNPLENIRNTNTVRYVMKNGELYEADTLDQIWPQQKKLPRQYWWDLEPKVRTTAPARPTVTPINQESTIR
jgi:Tol biopolymer transport system component